MSDAQYDTTVTRSEYHADSPAREVRESRRVVRAALERHCVGRENALHGSELADKVTVKDTTVRDIIAELRDDPQGPPVGNCGDGYFIIETADELGAWVDGVKDEIDTKEARIEANVQAFNRERYGGDDE